MKDKIRLALINRYKNLGFSDKAIEGVLAFLESRVTTEDQIDAEVGAVEGMLKAFQSEVDSRVSSAVQKAKEKPADPTTPKPDEPAQIPADAPEWMRTLATTMMQANKTLLEEVNALKTGNSTNTRKQMLEAKLKDVSEPVRTKILKDFSYMSFDSDEKFNTYLSETETEVQVIEQAIANSSLGQQSRPFQPGNATPKQLDADIASWAGAAGGTPPAK